MLLVIFSFWSDFITYNTMSPLLLSDVLQNLRGSDSDESVHEFTPRSPLPLKKHTNTEEAAIKFAQEQNLLPTQVQCSICKCKCVLNKVYI